MIKKLALFLLNLLILVIGVLWYLSEKGYEPLVVITGSIISLLSFLGVFSSSFDDVSTAILKMRNSKGGIDSQKISSSVIGLSKQFDYFVFYAKKTIIYVTSVLIIIAAFQALTVSSALKEMTSDEIVEQLDSSLPEDLWKKNPDDAVVLLFVYKSFNSKYSLFFILLALFVIMMHIFFIDVVNRFAYSSFSKKLSFIKNDGDFIKECRDINSELIHYEFKNKDIPEMLRLSISQAFSNLYLNNIK